MTTHTDERQEVETFEIGKGNGLAGLIRRRKSGRFRADSEFTHALNQAAVSALSTQQTCIAHDKCHFERDELFEGPRLFRGAAVHALRHVPADVPDV